MKYFIDAITAVLTFKEVRINRNITDYLQQQRVSMLLYLIVMLLGFNTAIALPLLVGMYILPLSVTLCILLFLFLSFYRIKATSFSPARPSPHKLNVADLLERDVVPLEMSEVCASLKGQVILVTGAAGSIGSQLCRQLLDYEPKLLIALDMNETGLFDLAEGLRSHPHITSLYLHIGDITNVQRMTRLFADKHPRVVFHAAAYKHVPLLEQYPDLAIRTNALATYHLCYLAQQYAVAHFVFISTDKAAEPVSVMGASKRLGELIVQSFAQSMSGTTRFCAVRFGNVIGSRGSVVPVFAQQIEQGGPLTVTDPRATRYFMTIPEACELVILTSAIADQGGLYLLDMGKPVRIIDLAVKMIRLCGLHVDRDIHIVYTGLRPGERLHETLAGADEELVPTTHSKISCVTYKDNLPTFAMIVQWIETLENSLQHEDVMRHRELLFELVHEQELISVLVG